MTKGEEKQDLKREDWCWTIDSCEIWYKWKDTPEQESVLATQSYMNTNEKTKVVSNQMKALTIETEEPSEESGDHFQLIDSTFGY